MFHKTDSGRARKRSLLGTIVVIGLTALIGADLLAQPACTPPPPDATGCEDNEVACDGTCVSLSNNEFNCGECGLECAFGACVNGVCQTTPAAPPDASPEAAPDAPVDAAPDASVSLDCNSYCTAILARCTGAQAQYMSLASCLGFCAKMPVGTPSDTTGNTLGCRVGHAVASATNPADECAKAGPAGGDTTAGGTPGACGDICESFCAVGTVVCPGQTSECATMLCPTYSAAPASYSTALTSGNNIGCRLYRLTLAAEDADAGAFHCTDVGVASDSCIP